MNRRRTRLHRRRVRTEVGDASLRLAVALGQAVVILAALTALYALTHLVVHGRLPPWK